MKIKIAADTPRELIELAKKINFGAIPQSQHAEKIEQLRQVAQKYGIPKRNGKVQPVEIELGNCPQELATLISQMDFSKYDFITKNIALTFIKKWLKNNGLMR